jgi:D-methionine transport system substrate-binding protein
VNIIAVRDQDKDKPWVAKLVVKAYQSEEVRKFSPGRVQGGGVAGLF